MPPLQVNAPEGKPSGSYGEGEAEKCSDVILRLTALQASRLNFLWLDHRARIARMYFAISDGVRVKC
jgi:hypothetical protein